MRNSRLKCPLCEQDYPEVSSLRRHLESFHDLQDKPALSKKHNKENIPESGSSNGSKNEVITASGSETTLHFENSMTVTATVVSDWQIVEFVKECLSKARINCNIPQTSFLRMCSAVNEILQCLRASERISSRIIKDSEKFLFSTHLQDKYIAGRGYITPYGRKISGYSFYYIPIISLLKHFLTTNELIDKLLTRVEDEHWIKKETHLRSEDKTIELNIFIDDFEGTSSMGKNAVTLSIVLMTINNLPHQYTTLKSHCLLLAIGDKRAFKSPSQRRAALQPLVEDLNVLTTSGLELSEQNRTEHFKVLVRAFCTDNKAAHEVLGLPLSFARGQACRFCALDRTQFESCVLSNEGTGRRTIEAYHAFYGLMHVSLDSSTVPCDIMHDLAEGVIEKVVVHLINELSKRKPQFLITLNRSMYNFKHWADGHVVNFKKPLRLQGTARQKLEFFNFIFELIEPQELSKTHQCVIMLKKIVAQAFSYKMKTDSINTFESDIQNFLKLYKSTYGKEKDVITPKMHYLLHLPSVIRENGPLYQFSNFSFERKIQFFKRRLQTIRNTINPAKSLSVFHQQQMALADKSGRLEITHGRLRPLTRNEVLFINALPNFGDTWSTVEFARYNSADVRKGHIKILCYENETPVFGIIDVIVINEEKLIKLYGRMIKVKNFNWAYFAYEIYLDNQVIEFKTFNSVMKYHVFTRGNKLMISKFLNFE
ncbi:hypothetical protein HDE_02277 [Halotydeus destructor]|nr:hypothetical protein HDE_02277 [Halotydeus destructor]